MRIVFTRLPAGGCVARLHRRDGVVVDLPSYSRKHRVPHDLAHFAAERELRLATGVYGSLAAGGMFSNAILVSGRPGHDAKARSKRILLANRRGITVAELLAGVVHHAVEHRTTDRLFHRARHDWGIVEERPFPFSPADIAGAVATLRAIAERWERLDECGELEEVWPDALTSPVPAAA